MKVPGRAWLEFTVEPRPGGGSRLIQRAVFFPSGLGGRLYWAAVFPFHGIIFSGMATTIAKTAATRIQVTKR
jgi:hypothetical protein